MAKMAENRGVQMSDKPSELEAQLIYEAGHRAGKAEMQGELDGLREFVRSLTGFRTDTRWGLSVERKELSRCQR